MSEFGMPSHVAVGNGELLTTEQATAYLGYKSTRTLMRKRVDGTGPVYARLAGRVLYRRTDLDLWVARHIVRHRAEELSRRVVA